MQKAVFTIRHARAEDEGVLSRLSADAFGPGRFARTAYRVREEAGEGAVPSWIAEIDGQIVGGVRFTPLRIGEGTEALLLGPVLVDPHSMGHGIGSALIQQGLEDAARQGYRLVLLVGDLPFYSRFGFVAVPRGQLALPGPVDPARLLARELVANALKESHGRVSGLRLSAPRGTK